MPRLVLLGLLCVVLAGCVTNTLSTQNAQIAATPARPAAPPPAPPPAPVPSPSARLVNARMVTMNETTTGGATLLLASPLSLNKDCTQRGQVDTKVITEPDHGKLKIEKGLAFPSYSPADPPYLCNAKKSPATLISYRAEPGYVGPDTAAVQVFFPDGRAPTLLFHINVQ